MTNFFSQHKKFMEYAGQEIPTVPAIYPGLNDFHKKLIDEEREELDNAYQTLKARHQDKTASPDEITKLQADTIKEAGDLIYVLTGFIRSLGVDPEKVMHEIARANLEKVVGKIIKDENTGKVLKPKEYKKADIIGMIKNHRSQNNR